MTNDELRELIWEKGRPLYRTMPWRDDTRPYYVLVSELMLQQTQVSRVIPKFEAFIAQFPDVEALAHASLADVLQLWQGLGYNRRAKFLHEAAKRVIALGAFPDTLDGLQELPGVGPNTAGAIMAYSYNQPVVFVETNVRTVLIHHVWPDDEVVRDGDIRAVLTEAVDPEHPREWYWAMMDYGTVLKASGVRTHRASAQYVKQSPLKGSVREVRGAIVAALTRHDALGEAQLRTASIDDERFVPALAGLVRDGLVESHENMLRLTK